MALDFKALAADLEKTGEDMTVAKTGGGDYVPPAVGPVRLRFFSYIELGKHEKVIQGKKKISEKVLLGFELSGPNHPPKEDGTPLTIYIEESKSLNEKANFFKLFSKMNHEGKSKHIVALLGNAYRGVIHHRKFKRADGSEGVVAELRAKGEPYDIKPTFYMDEESGTMKNVQVEALRSAERVFLWDRPDLDQWGSIFIEGEYEERKDEAGKVTKPAKSKNVYQARIMSALNFKGSPIETLLKQNGKTLDIPDVDVPDDVGGDDDQPETKAAAPVNQTDALNGVV